MNLDTRSKRASSVQVLMPFVLAPPLPDGSLDRGDWRNMAWSYANTFDTVINQPYPFRLRNIPTMAGFMRTGGWN